MLNAEEMNGKSPFPEELSREQRTAVEAVITRNCSKPGALIPVLEEVQEILGYLPKFILKEIALKLYAAPRSAEVYI